MQPGHHSAIVSMRITFPRKSWREKVLPVLTFVMGMEYQSGMVGARLDGAACVAVEADPFAGTKAGVEGRDVPQAAKVKLQIRIPKIKWG